jgi:hypothetical protein
MMNFYMNSVCINAFHYLLTHKQNASVYECWQCCPTCKYLSVLSYWLLWITLVWDHLQTLLLYPKDHTDEELCSLPGWRSSEVGQCFSGATTMLMAEYGASTQTLPDHAHLQCSKLPGASSSCSSLGISHCRYSHTTGILPWILLSSPIEIQDKGWWESL